MQTVKDGNKTQRRVNFLVNVAEARNVRNALESPWNSSFFSFPVIRATMEHHEFMATVAHMCQYRMSHERPQDVHQKSFQIWSSAWWICGLGKACDCKVKHAQLIEATVGARGGMGGGQG